MSLRHGIFFLLLAWLAVLSPAAADERILSYDSDLTVRSDGSLDVVETIRVRAEGSNIRRGIYRDFPTRYKDRLGNRVVVDFELLGVERDGKPEPNFTERLANGVRINTGNDDFLPTPGDFTFVLRYRSTRQLGFFADHDELYWNVTGLGWDFPIDAVQARVHLPSPVASQSLRLDGYTGRMGETGTDGRFLFEGLRPGPIALMVPLGDPRVSDDALLQATSLVVPEGGGEIAFEIDLPDGAIRVRVVDAATGAPVAGAWVAASPEGAGEDKERFPGVNWKIGWSGVADADGIAWMRGLTPTAPFTVRAMTPIPRHGSAQSTGIVAGTGAAPTEVTLRLAPGGR